MLLLTRAAYHAEKKAFTELMKHYSDGDMEESESVDKKNAEDFGLSYKSAE